MLKQTIGDWQSGAPPTCPKCQSSDKVAGVINTVKNDSSGQNRTCGNVLLARMNGHEPDNP